jgi:serine phosphatase RsbU (regulator of sigma subunit)
VSGVAVAQRTGREHAGHQPPLLASADGVRPLAGHGLPLGVDDRPRYGECELRLRDGDLVFAYTDGLIEARRGGEIFGSERLVRLVERAAGAMSAERLVRFVHGEIATWADGLTDDAVALALRRRP